MPKRSVRRILAGVLLGAVVCGVLTACSTVPIPPTYTDAELQAICERHGGWWRGNLIPGYCEPRNSSSVRPEVRFAPTAG